MKPRTVQSTKTAKAKAPTVGNRVAAAKPAECAPSTSALPEPPAKRKTVRKPAPAVIQKKPASPAETITMVAVKADVGFGNALFIRGQGNGLSWDKGTPLECVDASRWIWSTKSAAGRVEFKLLVNDAVWSQGENLTVGAGETVEVSPVF